MTSINYPKIIANILFFYAVLILGKTMASEYSPKSFFTGNYLEAAKAIYSNDIDGLDKALNQIGDVDKPGINQRYTLLIYAVKLKSKDSMLHLLENGASPTALAVDDNDREFSAIHSSITINDIGPLKIFIDNGISPDYTEKGVPIAFSAQKWNNYDALYFLMENKVDANKTTKIGKSLLMDALSRLDYDLAMKWIDYGADVHHIDSLGRSSPYFVQRDLESYIEGSEPYEKLQQIKQMMIDRGVLFPVLAPKEQRKSLGIVWCEDPVGWRHKSECNIIGE